MSALRIVLPSAALCASAAAFVQTGAPSAAAPATSLRHSGAAAQNAAEVTLVAGAPSGRVTVAGLGGLAVAGLGLAVASQRAGAARGVKRTECRVAGVCEPLYEKWDPLNLASTDAKLDQYTAAEVKHGRTAMLAVLGYIFPEIFRFPGCEGFENGVGALSTIPLEGWAQLVALLSAHEALVKPRQGGMGGFDFGFGVEVLDGISAQELERRLTSERNNGRLAMVAFWGLLVQDYMFGKTPLALLKSDGWWGPSVDYIIKDIKVCVDGTFCAEAPATGFAGRTATKVISMDVWSSKAEPKASPSMPFLKYPDQLAGWAGDKGFDPLNITDALPVYLVREAELKHCRLAMLATVGWIGTDLGARFPGELFQGATTLDGHDKMVAAGVFGPLLGAIGTVELYATWLTYEGWSGNINRDSGDFFLGKNFFPTDEAKAMDMRSKEIENGRLAMFAFSGIATQAVLTGKAWPFL